ncbi:hypothetical protein DC081_09025 [Ignatzschineria cameli]|uniref:hypothetical protein n=1 Tax=Ignatzschineria cameli TaxID=2182793 RepID=UPI000D605DBD|nr:hypothetical protein [Ignatzschineria cameli]PWD89582.1 hypothetical protein DC081_09025 [Ignatzschineria cameli]
MKGKLLELFSDREARFDNTKTITLLSLVIGWIVTIITIFKGTPDALYFFITMMAVGGGLTVTKGVVETKQKAIEAKEEE